MKYAIVQIGGKQYKIKTGDQLKVEKIERSGIAQDTIEFKDVLLVFNEDGKEVKIGRPTLEAKVLAKIIEEGRSKKVTVLKYKPKIRYRKKYGHRQPYTKIEIVDIIDF